MLNERLDQDRKVISKADIKSISGAEELEDLDYQIKTSKFNFFCYLEPSSRFDELEG